MLIDVLADEDDVIQEVAFLGGCSGNLQGICRLVKKQKIDDMIGKLDLNIKIIKYDTDTLPRLRNTAHRKGA